MRTLNKRTAVLVIAALAGGAISFPLGVLASHSFVDVPTGNTFHDDIAAIAAVGVTTGCSANEYCPKDYVTREQMAAFLNRLGALAPGKTPVVNAAKLDGMDSTDFLATDDITIFQTGGWAPYLFGAQLEFLYGETFVAIFHPDGAGVGAAAIVPLQAPGTIGAVAYGLKSVEICWLAADVTIDHTQLAQAGPSGGAFVASSDTDHSMDTAGCYTVTDETPTAPVGQVNLRLVLDFESDVFAKITRIKSTWTPVR
jgi:hypothetical protein